MNKNFEEERKVPETTRKKLHTYWVLLCSFYEELPGLAWGLTGFLAGVLITWIL